jgi:hypothetical protein
MTMITMESRTPSEKNAGPAVPVPNLEVSGGLGSSARIKTALKTYDKIFMQEENQIKNNWYHRVSRRSSAGTGMILIQGSVKMLRQVSQHLHLTHPRVSIPYQESN